MWTTNYNCWIDINFAISSDLEIDPPHQILSQSDQNTAPLLASTLWHPLHLHVRRASERRMMLREPSMRAREVETATEGVGLLEARGSVGRGVEPKRDGE